MCSRPPARSTDCKVAAIVSARREIQAYIRKWPPLRTRQVDCCQQEFMFPYINKSWCICVHMPAHASQQQATWMCACAPTCAGGRTSLLWQVMRGCMPAQSGAVGTVPCAQSEGTCPLSRGQRCGQDLSQAPTTRKGSLEGAAAKALSGEASGRMRGERCSMRPLLPRRGGGGLGSKELPKTSSSVCTVPRVCACTCSWPCVRPAVCTCQMHCHKLPAPLQRRHQRERCPNQAYPVQNR